MAVYLRPIGAQSWRTLPSRIRSGDTFATPGDPPGRYVVTTSALSGWTLQSVSRGGKTVADDVIELASEDVADVVLTFSTKASRVSGSITDAKGAADTDADVILFPADTTSWRDGVLTNRQTRFMHATSAGGFEFEGLPPGDYCIAAVSARLTTGLWQNLSQELAAQALIERLVPGAIKFSLNGEEERVLPLKTFVPRDR